MLRAFAREKVPIPKDFRVLAWDKERPLDIEIGCGVGFHALQYARAHSERQILAFERTSEKFAKFARRLENHVSLPNLTAIHGDAVPWISHGIGPESVDRYFLLYPNPYPKESQRNQRWYGMPFAQYLVETLKVGGTIILVTNMEYYSREAKVAWLEFPLRVESERIVASDETPRTHFERKYLARGEVCYETIYRKIGFSELCSQ